MVETPENVTLLLGTIIFFQDHISVGMFLHPPENVLVRNPAVSRFRSIFQVGEQIIPLTLRTARSSMMASVHTQKI